MKNKLNCILLVDDYESDNFLHKRIIDKACVANHVEIAMNGREAIELLTKAKNTDQQYKNCAAPELLFLDINMPVMDGWEFLEEFRDRDDIQKDKIIIIILTTSINPADQKRAEGLTEVSRYCFKPLTLPMLTEIIEEYFPGNQ